MSMIANFKQISSSQLEELKKDPSLIEEIIYPDSESDIIDNLDIDKAWQGIHFILTGKVWEVEGLLGKVIMGGKETGDDVGYGPARYLTSIEVKDISNVLTHFSEDEFKSRFNPDKIVKNKIYPFTSSCEAENLEYLLSYFKTLKKFYEDCANKGNAMLIYIN